MSLFILAEGTTIEPMDRFTYLDSIGLNGSNEGTKEQLLQTKGYKLKKANVTIWVREEFLENIQAEQKTEQPATESVAPFDLSEMKSYSPSSLSKIRAKPMTVGAYNALRNWTNPSDIDPEQKGFLVEDEARSKNHDLFENGITWIEENAFNATYEPSETHGQRLCNDHYELRSRTQKLESFLEKVGNLDISIPPSQFHLDLLNVQLQQMYQLERTINTRVCFSEPRDAMEYGSFPVPAITTGISHEAAMLFCELGYPILRKGWNGNTQFVYMSKPTTVNVGSKATKKLGSQTIITKLDKEFDAYPWNPSPADVKAKDWVVLFKF